MRSSLICTAFSHDVTAAKLVFQKKERATMLLYRTNPMGIELFLHLNNFFCSNKFAWLLIATQVKMLYSIWSCLSSFNSYSLPIQWSIIANCWNHYYAICSEFPDLSIAIKTILQSVSLQKLLCNIFEEWNFGN